MTSAQLFNLQVNGLPLRNDELEQATADILHVYLLVRGYWSDRRRPGHQAMGGGVGQAHVQHHRVRRPGKPGPVSR